MQIITYFATNSTADVRVRVRRGVVPVPIPQARIRAVVPIPANNQDKNSICIPFDNPIQRGSCPP